ncbi:MAG: tol-pal system protein YbgF [Burkholderiales bacterium]
MSNANLLALAVTALVLGSSGSCFAGLFSDDEAREKIKQLEQRTQALETQLHNQGLEMLSQIEKLRAELAELHGQVEVHTHDIESTQKRQRDLYVDLDARLRELENARVSVPVAAAESGQTAGAGPPAAASGALSETAAYEAAYNLFHAGDYKAAIAAFQGFMGNYAESPLVASAHYWVGNSYFAMDDYGNAIASQRTLIKLFPDSSKVPDALLNIASSQRRQGDARAEKKTLQEIVAKHPTSDAAIRAKQRLSAP